jgi:hypothetical protein
LLEADAEMKYFETLRLTQIHVDQLYVESAKRFKYGLMDGILGHHAWPKPTVNAENVVLQTVLNSNHYDRARWMLTKKPGKKPRQEILDSFVAKAAENGGWFGVDRMLNEIYSGGSISVSQELTDVLYVYAAAHANEKYLRLLTSEAWAHRPTQKAKDNAFVHACMNNHTKLMEIFAMENLSIEPEMLFNPFVSPFSVPEAFDQGLIETVRYRRQAMFDMLLNVYADQLSEAGMKAALEQAGKPSQGCTDPSKFDSMVSQFSDNHYQKCLKRKLGILDRETELINLSLQQFTLNPDLFKVALPELDFTMPELDFTSIKPDDAAAAAATPGIVTE